MDLLFGHRQIRFRRTQLGFGHQILAVGIVQFLLGGAGMQFLDVPLGVSSGTVFIGLVWLTGFCVAACICLAVSFWLFARGFGTGD